MYVTRYISICAVCVQEVQAINGIGKRIADKVVEIMDSGGLRRLNHVDPKMEVIQLFMGIWGAGPETAKKWHSEVSSTQSVCMAYKFILASLLFSLKHGQF